jgi:FkbM family methyltransferase
MMDAGSGRYFRRHAATEFGFFDVLVSPGCQLNVLDPRGLRIDPVHARFVRRWVADNSIVWDIGANMGLFAFPAALRCHKGGVYCFEADIETAVKLLQSTQLKRNQDLNVSVCALAVADRDGVSEFLISRFGRSMNKLLGSASWHSDLFEARETRPIPTLSIDTIAATVPRPDIIKIDVEGAEMLVLRGGRSTIMKARPTLLVESPREIWSELAAFLEELDYVMLDGQSDDLRPLAEPVWDTVAVPREKLQS